MNKIAGAPMSVSKASTSRAPDDPRLDLSTPLRPGNAVAAVIVVEGRYLLQLRDAKHGIFFPAHWGCFGGGVDPGETVEQALARELEEELGLTIGTGEMRYFSRFEFGLDFAGLQPIWRIFYEITISEAQMAKLSLGEGSDMRLFPAEGILTYQVPLTPYDAFALWMHINRSRLVG
jgi:8-oxo-dGTP pyrophosphatase MutT (NUDIX family)